MIFLRNIINDLENRIFFLSQPSSRLIMIKIKTYTLKNLKFNEAKFTFYTLIIQNKNGLLQKASTLFLITPKLRFVEISQASFCHIGTH